MNNGISTCNIQKICIVLLPNKMKKTKNNKKMEAMRLEEKFNTNTFLVVTERQITCIVQFKKHN